MIGLGTISEMHPMSAAPKGQVPVGKRILLLIAFASLAGCGEREPTVVSPQRDIERLADLMSDDLELQSLTEVRGFVSDDLPVRAAELLEAGTLPAARAHQQAVAEASMITPTGRGLRDEAAVLLQARVDSLDSYRAALERGLIEDLVLLESIQQQRAAEDALLTFMTRLEQMLDEEVE